MRIVLSHQGLNAASVLGKVTRELHLAVPPGENARISRAEAEANRIALNDENARCAPTRVSELAQSAGCAQSPAISSKLPLPHQANLL